jgi:hypothetical protein
LLLLRIEGRNELAVIVAIERRDDDQFRLFLLG